VQVQVAASLESRFEIFAVPWRAFRNSFLLSGTFLWTLLLVRFCLRGERRQIGGLGERGFIACTWRQLEGRGLGGNDRWHDD
jgi:hypothetical protein